MPIFISHRQADKEDADRLFVYLKNRGVPAYIDSLEPSLSTEEDITKKILDRLGHCTHLMAYLSPNTQGSWWVPFEIGVATEKESRISSVNFRKITLPGYLKQWPELATQEHLDYYIELYNSDRVVQKSTADAARARIQSAGDFHRALKSYISVHP